MKNIMKKFGNIDYRVIDLSKIREKQLLYYFFLMSKRKRNKKIEFEEENLRKKIFPEETLENSKSIILCFFPYLTPNHSFEGNISIAASGLDYHIWVKEKMKEINEEFISEFPFSKTYIQVDNGPIDEKFFAYHSGIGYLGKNSLIIHEKYGSHGFLGILVSDIKLEHYTTEKKECLKCGICIKKCPSKALNYETEINPNKCLAYLTQKKEDLTLDEEMKIFKSGKIYGCDICQKFCPMNKYISYSERKDSVINNISNEEINRLSNREFNKIYGNRSFSWRGKKILQRNLNILNKYQEY